MIAGRAFAWTVSSVNEPQALSPAGNTVVQTAIDLAVRWHHREVGVPHLIVAVHADPASTAARLLAERNLTSDLMECFFVDDDSSDPSEVCLSDAARTALEAATRLAAVAGHPAGADLILLGALAPASPETDDFLGRLGTTRQSLRDELSMRLGPLDRAPVGAPPRPANPPAVPRAKTNPVPAPAPSRTALGAPRRSTLDEVAVNLTARAVEGRLDPVVGRDDEIRRVIGVLSRRTKANPVLVGDAGVGKTAVVEGLAQRVVAGAVPASLVDAQIFALDVGALVAGTTYRGDFERRVKDVVAAVRADPRIVLFIDEIHTLLSAGGGSSAVGAADMIKPLIARGDLRVVGATTREEYVRYIERDPALERRFTQVAVEEPSLDEARRMVEAVVGHFSAHHGVAYTDDALEAAVALSDRHLPDRRLPDKALDLLDEAGADRRLLDDPSPVDADAIAVVLSRWTGATVTADRDESRRLRDAERVLGAAVVGQTDAVAATARALRRHRTGLSDPRRPLSLLAIGPSGVGKSLLAEELARLLFDADEALVRLDMSEFAEEHTVSRLFGAPPGYVGHNDPGQLTDAVRRRPHSLVLLDEMDKAHPRVLDALLPVLESGRLTDGRGRVVDFSHCVIVMTANVAVPSGRGVGFSTQAATDRRDATRREELRRLYRPEFLNRIDQVLTFSELDHDQRAAIARLEVDRVVARAAARGVTLEVAPAVLDWLADHDYDPAYGARPLRRTLHDEVLDAVATRMLEEPAPDVLLVTLDGDALVVADAAGVPTI